MQSIRLSAQRIVLSIVALWAFGVAQPLFELMVRHPAFLTAHEVTGIDVVALCVGLSILLPVLLGGVLLILHRLLPRFGACTFYGCMTLLVICMLAPIAWRLDISLALQLAGLALVVGLLAALYSRTKVLATFLEALSVAALAFPLLFVFSDAVSRTMAGQLEKVDLRATSTPPIVVVVFDELPTHALTGGSAQLASKLVPNFARLAQQSTWYRNASAVSSRTERALPALVSGLRPDVQRTVGDGPNAASFPKTLFSLLASQYDLVAFESITGLCPAPACQRLGQARKPNLVADLVVAYAHTLVPEAWSGWLPDIGNQWGGFRWGRLTEHTGEAMGIDRNRDAREFMNTIGPGEQPTLYFAHLLLPHVPYHFLPNGDLLFRHQALRAVTQNQGADHIGTDPVAIEELRQLFVWQLQYVDHIVGALLDHLEATGLLEETLLIVTADHGVSVSPDSKRRRVDHNNMADLASIPLFVKYPGQRKAKVVNRNVANIDLLATIAETIGATIPWRTDSLPLSSADRTTKQFEDDDHIHQLAPTAALPDAQVAARWSWLKRFAKQKNRPAYPSNTPVATARSPIEMERASIYDNVVPEVFVPALIRATSQSVFDEDLEVLVHVNHQPGVHALTYVQDGVQHLVAFIPPEDFILGANHIAFVGRLNGAATLLYENH